MSWSPLHCLLNWQAKYVCTHPLFWPAKACELSPHHKWTGDPKNFICVLPAGCLNKTIKFCVKRLNRCLLFFHFKLQTLTVKLNLLFNYSWKSKNILNSSFFFLSLTVVKINFLNCYSAINFFLKLIFCLILILVWLRQEKQEYFEFSLFFFFLRRWLKLVFLKLIQQLIFLTLILIFVLLK